ncbi:MAG: protein kinase [Myxococcota bacterium]|nr:protein kinase [Myxococcota bacterium]
MAVRATSELFVVKVSGEHGFRRDIVLKRLRDDSQAQTFIDDAKLSAKLSHAKIVQTLELGSIEDVPYVAMEYVDGVDLLGLLRELARTRRSLDPALAAWIAQELLDALDYTHTFADELGRLQIVHGRLSPSKVLLGDSGEVKLCDFGVARRFDLAHSGGHDFGHLSPEQVMEQAVDPRSDVFGVGVLLAEMLMRKRLFAAHNEFDVLLMVRDVRISRLELGGVDHELVAIVQKALEKKPEERWQSAAAFRDALDAWLFAKRAAGMNQQLAALVGEVRVAVDEWRRAGSLATPELDDLPDSTGPDSIGPVATSWARGSISPPSVRIVAIPPKQAKDPERTAARGTAQPETKPDAPATPTSAEPAAAPAPPAASPVMARGTEAVPLPKPIKPDFPTDPIPSLPQRTRGSRAADVKREATPKPEAAPKPIAKADSQRSSAHPRLVARGAVKPIGIGLQDLLPERTPAEQRQKAQLLTQEQLAKAGQPPPPKLAQLERAPDDGGDFERTTPLRVLFHLMRARATGLLAVTLGSVRKDVYVRDGQLAGVWSNDASDLFGNYLVAQKVLSDGELAMALATMSYYGGKIGDTLVGLGLVDRMEVFRQLTRHARTKVVDICTWNAGRYAWYAGKEDPRESFPLEAEAFSMLGEAALALRADVIDPWLAKHRDARLVAVKTQRIAPDVFVVPSANEVFAWIDGARTLGGIVDTHADRARTARILYLFLACDLVRLG